MVDLFPGQKIDLPPANDYESPDWLQGFPQHRRRLLPLVTALQRVKNSEIWLMDHVVAVRELARWIDFLFRESDAIGGAASSAASHDDSEDPTQSHVHALESKIDMFCVHRGMRTNCVTVELYFQVIRVSQRFVLMAHKGQSGTTWLFPRTSATPEAVYKNRREFVKNLVGLQTFTLRLFRDRVTDRPYALSQLVNIEELEDYYRYTRAYGFWLAVQLTLSGRHCIDPSTPPPPGADYASDHVRVLGEALKAALECHRMLAEIQLATSGSSSAAFLIGERYTVPIPRALELDDKRRKKPDGAAEVQPICADTRWEALVHPMVLALRAEWANYCATTSVRPLYLRQRNVCVCVQEKALCAYLMQQLLRYGFDHPSRRKWDPSSTLMLGFGMPFEFPTAGAVTQILKAMDGAPDKLLTGADIGTQ